MITTPSLAYTTLKRLGDENPIRTLGDYSKPSHKGYWNTIELSIGNNVDLALYDNESWNNPWDFTKSVKEIALPQDVPSTSDRRLIELENQVQRLMESHLASTQATQVNKITTSCKICSGPHDAQYCMEDPEQAFAEYASSRTDETRVSPSSNTELVCTKKEDDDVMFIEIVPMDDNSRKEEPEAGEQKVEYFDIFLTRSKLTYHKYLMENANGGVSNFIGRIKEMHVFVGKCTYVVDFMIIEDISSIIDLRLSQVVLGKPFVEISNMTHDPKE
nr:MAK10-like protein [Tanacetum cinerariifolium]